MPMTPVPLAAESWQLDSTPAAQHRLLNLFAEALPDNARGKFYLKSTPGLTQLAVCGSGPVTSTATISDTFFVISGTNAYRLTDTGGVISAPVTLGSVGASTGDYYHTSIAIGLVGPVFVQPPRAYVGSFTGGTFNQIVTGGGNFPAAGVSSVCYLDGYYIFTVFDGEYFFTSDLLDPTTFSGLSYVKMSSQVDFVEHGIPHKGELWLFGQNTISAWYNTGDPTNPFAPRTGAVINTGCGSYRTICDLDGSLFFLGVDGVIYRTNGYQAKRISTHAIEEVLATGYAGGYMRTIVACGFSHEGHSFYALSLPASGRTFVYDCGTGLWHERSSSDLGIGRWTVNTASDLPARSVLGDSVDGRLWVQDRNTVTEKGVAVRRLAQLPALVTHGPRAFMSRFELEMEVGIGGLSTPVLLSWSDDGGAAYNTPRQIATGTLGQTRKRAFTTRLGSFRQRVFRLTGNGAMTVYSADAEMGTGES